ncbi:hypothetical protein LTR28_004657 [Elasticomyces elasticus]|nr:hypothetical protein LTR28_004657 [Elasticomyces elasticus]
MEKIVGKLLEPLDPFADPFRNTASDNGGPKDSLSPTAALLEDALTEAKEFLDLNHWKDVLAERKPDMIAQSTAYSSIETKLNEGTEHSFRTALDGSRTRESPLQDDAWRMPSIGRSPNRALKQPGGSFNKHRTKEAGAGERSRQNKSLHNVYNPIARDGEDDDDPEELVPKRGPAHRVHKMQTQLDSGEVTIFVGQKGRYLRIQRQATLRHGIFNQYTTYDNELGWTMKVPFLIEQLEKPHEFQSVAEFLESGDFQPQFGKNGKGEEVLKALISPQERNEGEEVLKALISPQERNDAVVQCGMTYYLAANFRLVALQHLCFRKLRALWPYAPVPIIAAATAVFRSPVEVLEKDFEMPYYIKEYLIDNFVHLMGRETGIFRTLLCRHETLAKAVYGALSEDPQRGGEGFDEEMSDSG